MVRVNNEKIYKMSLLKKYISLIYNFTMEGNISKLIIEYFVKQGKKNVINSRSFFDLKKHIFILVQFLFSHLCALIKLSWQIRQFQILFLLSIQRIL